MEEQQKIFEERFILDYFRFAININLYGVAPYVKAISESIIDLPAGEKINVNNDILRTIGINTHPRVP